MVAVGHIFLFVLVIDVGLKKLPSLLIALNIIA